MKNLKTYEQFLKVDEEAGKATHAIDEGGLHSVKVIFKDPRYNYTTSVSAETTEKDARDYFVGKTFDVGTYPKEDNQECVDIEYKA